VSPEDNPITSLPALRDELSLHPAPSSRSGSPAWTIYDPVRNLFFQIDWLTFEVLSRWPLSSAKPIVKSINQDTTLKINTETIDSVLHFLSVNNLTKRSQIEDTDFLSRQYKHQQHGPLKSLLHKYLFFRIPLWNPDEWLSQTLPYVKWLGSAWFSVLSLLVLLIGLVQVTRQWDQFTNSLVDLYSIQGLLAYAITIVGIKFIHELGHAYTAKHYGCLVPRMGIAFLVMLPMAYTDVNDVWRLTNKKQRLSVGAAGIRTELTIAVWATLLWTLLPEGSLKMTAFILATITWISTFAINASPFMRFDGYFLLMDAIEQPNLHSRSFELARWKLRQWLFSLNDEVPEQYSRERHRFLILFAFGTWFYRLVVFGGIALLIYFMVPKPLGPILAAIEIYWFILAPIFSEFIVWKKRSKEIAMSARSKQTLAILASFILLITLPWDSRIATQSILKVREIQALTSPVAAQIIEINVTSGEFVKTNQTLLRLESPDLTHQLNAAKQQSVLVQREIDKSAISFKLHQQLPVLNNQFSSIQSRIEGIEQQLAKLKIKAESHGTMHWLDPDLQTGDWIEKNTILGNLKRNDDYAVHAYVKQEDLNRIEVGMDARFYDSADMLQPVDLKVSRIDSDSTRVLSDKILAATHHGAILVRQNGKQLIPENVIYHVVLKPIESNLLPPHLPELTGETVIFGTPRAWGTSYWRYLVATVRREASF